MKFAIALAIGFFAYVTGAQAAGVVVTIKPLHSLVAAIMDGDGNPPLLLVSGKESLHNFSLKPSQAKALQNADIVFYLNDDFEGFMKKTLKSLPENTRKVPLARLPGISLLPLRNIDGFDKHADEHEEAHSAKALDMHIWLNPHNAKVMMLEIARQLSITYPDKRSIYFENTRKLGARLNALDRALSLRLAKLQGKPYVVFHDAYQYFDGLYGLSNVGAITMHPEQGVSAKRISDLRARIKKSGATCVFREPQFDGKIVENLLLDTKVKSGVLDPEGALLTPGKDLYFQLMEGLASGLEQCLLAP